MVGSISQGVDASDVAFTLRASDIGQLSTASGTSQGLNGSAMVCAHRLGNIGVDQQKVASVDFYTNLTWHVRFEQAMSAIDRRHWSWTARIGRGLCTSLSRRWP